MMDKHLLKTDSDMEIPAAETTSTNAFYKMMDKHLLKTDSDMEIPAAETTSTNAFYKMMHG